MSSLTTKIHSNSLQGKKRSSQCSTRVNCTTRNPLKKLNVEAASSLSNARVNWDAAKQQLEGKVRSLLFLSTREENHDVRYFLQISIRDEQGKKAWFKTDQQIYCTKSSEAAMGDSTKRHNAILKTQCPTTVVKPVKPTCETQTLVHAVGLSWSRNINLYWYFVVCPRLPLNYIHRYWTWMKKIKFSRVWYGFDCIGKIHTCPGIPRTTTTSQKVWTSKTVCIPSLFFRSFAIHWPNFLKRPKKIKSIPSYCLLPVIKKYPKMKKWQTLLSYFRTNDRNVSAKKASSKPHGLQLLDYSV